jgi:hypothetical protein
MQQIDETTRGVTEPRKTVLPDGRLTTKEAWNLCVDLCKTREIKPPKLRIFKSCLKENRIDSIMVPNPFGGAGPRKVYAVEAAAVKAFVAQMEREGVLSVGSSGPVIRRRKTLTVENPQTPPAAQEDRELNTRDAYNYVVSKASEGCVLNQTTFGFYLTYDLIPSRFEGRQRMVRVGDLDAYVELFPDGVYANHNYSTDRKDVEFSMREAYVHYASVDPTPVSMNTFRSLVTAGIIRAVRGADDPSAPILGFSRQEISGFLALRQRIMEKNADTPAIKSFVTRKRQRAFPEVAKLMQEAVEKARPQLEAAKKKDEEERRAKKAVDLEETAKPEIVEPDAAPEVERVSLKEGYERYKEFLKEAGGSPYSFSWFRQRASDGDVFDVEKSDDVHPGSPFGKKYMVSVESIEAYVRDHHDEQRPRVIPVAVETAYHKYRDVVPPGISLLQFKRMVKDGLIKSSRRNGTTKVTRVAVEEYFTTRLKGRFLKARTAYDYYCSRATDPVSEAHFNRLLRQGEIDFAEKKGKSWVVESVGIDLFLERHPTGRVRENRKSKVKRSSQETGRKWTAGRVARLAWDEDPPKRAPVQTLPSETRVMVSIADYPEKDDLKRAIELLTSQGFDVEVKP